VLGREIAAARRAVPSGSVASRGGIVIPG
jgi:hypothetical protein